MGNEQSRNGDSLGASTRPEGVSRSTSKDGTTTSVDKDGVDEQDISSQQLRRQRYDSAQIAAQQRKNRAKKQTNLENLDVGKDDDSDRQAAMELNMSARTQIANKGRRLFSDFHDAQADYARKWGESKGLEGIKELFEKEAPRLAGKYEIIAPEACGVTAVVCRGVDKSNGQPVAVKFVRIRVPGLADSIRRKDCIEEARLQQLCSHKNVVSLFDFELGRNFALYILEYVSSTLLQKIVERNSAETYSERTAAGYIKDLASALAHIHSQGVVHMDLKLDNVLCTEENVAKLCDFGVAEQMQFSNTPIRRSVAAPLFAPPEVYTSGYCNTQADMWSLGVILYILLCGYPPFKETDLKPRIIKARYTFPERDWTGVSIMARDLISRLLTLDTRKRYSAQQVLNHPWIKAVSSVNRSTSVNSTVSMPSATATSASGDSMLPGGAASSSNFSPTIHSQGSLDEKATKEAIAQVAEEDAKASKFIPLPMRVTQFLRNMHHYRELEKRGFDSVPGGQLYRSILDGVDEITIGMAQGPPSPSWLSKKINHSIWQSLNEDEDGNGDDDLEEGNDDESTGTTPKVKKSRSFLPNLADHLGPYYFPDDDHEYSSEISMSRKANDSEKPLRKQNSNMDDEGGEGTDIVLPPTLDLMGTNQVNMSAKDVYAQSRLMRKRSTSSMTTTSSTAGLATSGDVASAASIPLDRRPIRQKSFDVHPEAPAAWIDDAEAITCRICDSRFTVLRRRHHCRLCGNVCCADCASRFVAINVLRSKKQVRACKLCAAHWQAKEKPK